MFDHIGPYEIRGELGRGAMARVWRAWDPNLEREVAIKEPIFDPRLPEEVLSEMGRRFVKEGRTAAKLHHPGIVDIYAADVYDGRPAIVMELIDGITFSDLIANGPLNTTLVVNALAELLDAVGYAHAQGVVHRDIKPDNIFIDMAGHVKLSDFGIAYVEDSNATRSTVAGTILGTPGYMSPEQAKGTAVDSRSDLFSIGVVGYEMLAGYNPFGTTENSSFASLIYRIVNEPVPELPDYVVENYPIDFRPAIQSALNKNPDDRPQTAADFKAMLLGHSASSTSSTNVHADKTYEIPVNVPVRSKRNYRWVPYVITSAVCVIALIVFVSILSFSGSGGTTVIVDQNGAGNEQSNEAIAAIVKGEEIKEDDVTSVIQGMRAQMGLEDETAWGEYLVRYGYTPQTIRYQFIYDIANHVILEKGAREFNIVVEPDEVDDYLAQIRSSYDSDDAWQTFLMSLGMTEDEYRDSIYFSFLSKKLRDHFVSEMSEEEKLDAANSFASQYDGARRSSHILFAADNWDMAESVLDQINSGQLDFNEAVKQYSIDVGSIPQDGDVGWDELTSFPDVYQNALNTLEPGQMSDLVSSEFGIHIIKCTDKFTNPSNLTSLDQIPDELLDDINAREAYGRWLGEQMNDVNLIVNDMPSGLIYDVDLTPYQSSAS